MAKVTTSDSESTSHSTDPGDSSSAELSDHSEPTSVSPEAEGSDNERPQHELVLEFLLDASSVGAPPGLSLKAPPSGGTRLSSKAQLFVPSFGATSAAMVPEAPSVAKPQLRQNISLVQGLPEDNFFLEQDQQPDDAHMDLQKSIANLTAEEAAMLRSVLDSKCAADSMQQPFSSAPWCSLPTLGSGMPMNMMTAGMSPVFIPCPAAVMQFPAPPMMAPAGSFCYKQQPSGVRGGLMAQQVGPYTHFGQGIRQHGSAKVTRNTKTHTNTADAPKSTTDDLTDTLRTNLRDLSLMNPSCVLMVRKINRLGLDSCKLLEAYFSKFGTVDRMMVSHSRARSIFGKGACRVRPAGLGFLIMAKAEDVEAILAIGTEHEVEGVSISTHPFESRSIEGAEDVADEPQGAN